MTNEEFLAELRRLIDQVYGCRARVMAVPGYREHAECKSFFESAERWIEAYERDYRYFMGLESIEKSYHVTAYLGHCEVEVSSFKLRWNALQAQI
jgi:hypothetical protein